MPVSRRSLVKMLSASTFVIPVGSLAQAVASATGRQQGPLQFPQGVASADPTEHSVMLWTRAEPHKDSDTIALRVEVSDDPEFSVVLVDSPVTTGPDSDYTVRAYITGLIPNSSYYYRFRALDGSTSRTGRTRTAPPKQDNKTVNMAFVSCQSYEQGYYAAWARMIADDTAAPEQEQIQFVLQLGDFIYERSWHTREDGTAPSRRLPDFPDGVAHEHYRYALSLADYRHLYKTYLSDPHLQEARARWPFISTWDDHEFANDNFQSYSTYGGAATLEAGRKIDANQAWFEFVPAVLSELTAQPTHDFKRQPLKGNEEHDNAIARDSLCIYRRLSWGANLDLVLTDNRSYRSPPCLSEDMADSLGLPLNSIKLIEIADYGIDYNNGAAPEFLPYGDQTTPNPGYKRAPGSCLGEDQRSWFLESMAQSSARWKLWGNSLPLMPMRIDLSSIPFAGYEDSVVNIDAWPGYPHEMNTIMETLATGGITGVVSLSGDHHLHGAATIGTLDQSSAGAPVCVDFSCAGISSTPFFESIVAGAKDQAQTFRDLVYTQQDSTLSPIWHMTMLQGVLASLAYTRTGSESVANLLGPNNANPGLQFMDCTANGYGVARFEANSMQVDLVAMEDVRTAFTRPPAIGYRATFRLDAWQSGQGPQLMGPYFSGTPPFPYRSDAV